jgi:RimJ/RimL family protein N-acetyltransferase
MTVNQALLSGKLVILKKSSSKDKAQILKWNQDTLVSKYRETGKPKRLNPSPARRSSTLSSDEAPGDSSCVATLPRAVIRGGGSSPSTETGGIRLVADALKGISFSVFDRDKGILIGEIGISSIDTQNKHAEIGMAIGDRGYWGKGYGQDLVKTILDYCFTTLKLNKVYLDVWQENKRAINCYLKSGFKQEGLLREHVLRGGKYHHKLVMSILKREWQRK